MQPRLPNDKGSGLENFLALFQNFTPRKFLAILVGLLYGGIIATGALAALQGGWAAGLLFGCGPSVVLTTILLAPPLGRWFGYPAWAWRVLKVVFVLTWLGVLAAVLGYL